MYHVSHEIFTSGFSLVTGPSTVPGAGNGVFVAEGEVPLSSGECLRTEY